MELLAPAGGTEQLISAVENGADAVYLGGRLYNARINASNFSDEELQQAVDFCHRRGVQVHVTMNTLLRDDELADALEYAGFLYSAGVDALIVQDLGLASLIRQFMPDLSLHFSTQGTVYDLRGAEAAARLGFDRVVLARELSLPEIRQIARGTDIETEVFVHGALCICYSGQCQLSRYYGGRSGNRGACAQPCRLPYKTMFEDGVGGSSTGGREHAPDGGRRTGQGFVPAGTAPPYPLSPRDQCLIDHLGELAEAGVASLKIEGRMKSPEYVGVVTSIYRKYLDEYYARGSYRVSEQDRLALEQIFNRGGFTDAYLRGYDDDRLMSGDIPKHRGVLAGHVLKRVKGTDLVDVRLAEESSLEMGDGAEIRGSTVTGNIVTYYKKETCGPGTVRIGDIRGAVSKGAAVYRISRKSQLEEIRRTWKNVDIADDGNREQRRMPVNMKVIAGSGRVRLVVSTQPAAWRGRNVSADAEFAADIVPEDGTANSTTDLQRFEAALRKTGSTPYEAADIQFAGSWEGIHLKVSEMNRLRREGLTAFAEALTIRREKPLIWYMGAEPEQELLAVERYYFDWESFSLDVSDRKHSAGGNGRSEVPEISVIPMRAYLEHVESIPHGAPVIPYISNVTRGTEEEWLAAHYEEMIAACRSCGVYVGTLSWIAPLRSEGVPVYGDYGLNVYNEQTRAALSSLGVRHCADSLEAMGPWNGAWPLMTLQHVPAGSVLDPGNREPLRIAGLTGRDQAVLFPEHVDFPDGDTPRGGGIFRIYKAPISRDSRKEK